MPLTLKMNPLYLQLRDVLFDRIATGAWRPREAMPNEFELANELKVSIGTVRKAVDMLVTEGLVVRKQGRGTFVVDPESPTFTERLDRLRNADGSRIVWKKTSVSYCLAIPDEIERAQLRLTDPAASVIRFVRIRRDHSGPLKFEKAVVLSSRFPISQDLFAHSDGIREMAQLANIMIGTSVAKIRVEAVDDVVASGLEVAKGSTLMRVDRVIADAAGIPLEGSVSWYALKDKYYVSVH